MKIKSAYRKPDGDRNFREELGLKLDDIASFCGVSVSMLGMIESGERHWPWKTKGNHLKLIVATCQSIENPIAESLLPMPEAWEKKAFGDEIRNLNVKKLLFEKQLKKMAFQYGQAKTLYQTCARLKPEFPDEDSKEFSAILYWEQLSETRLRETGPIPQKRLQMKMEELDRQIEWLGELCIKE